MIHLGGNDLGRIKTLDLLFMIKHDLQRFKFTFPKTTIIFFEIVPRLTWYSPDLKPLEKIRKRTNRFVEKFMPDVYGFSFRHFELEGGISGLYRQDGIHLSDIGLDILNLGLQSCIEMAAVLG